MRTGGLLRAHDLDRSVARLGREEGAVEDAFQVTESFGEVGPGPFEVERGELVERGLPLPAGLELNAGLVAEGAPAGGSEELADTVGPIGKRFLNGGLRDEPLGRTL